MHSRGCKQNYINTFSLKSRPQRTAYCKRNIQTHIYHKIELCNHRITSHKLWWVQVRNLHSLLHNKYFLEQTSEKERLNMKKFFNRSVKIRSIFKPSFVFYLKQLFHILIIKITDAYCHGNFDTWVYRCQERYIMQRLTLRVSKVTGCWHRCMLIYITLVPCMSGLYVCSLQ
jgi:hypothetical protein